MTIAKYFKECPRTLAPLDSYEMNVLHMTAGIITEIGELIDPFKKNLAYGEKVDIVNVGEEIADVMWYVCNNVILAEVEKEMIFPIEEPTLENCEKLFKMKSLLKDTPTEITLQLGVAIAVNDRNHFTDPNNVFKALFIIAYVNGIDFYKQLDKNINKLKARYPDKFDSDKAINRNLEVERKTLEE